MRTSAHRFWAREIHSGRVNTVSDSGTKKRSSSDIVSGRKTSGAASLRKTFSLSIGLISRQNSVPATGSGVTMEPPRAQVGAELSGALRSTDRQEARGAETDPRPPCDPVRLHSLLHRRTRHAERAALRTRRRRPVNLSGTPSGYLSTISSTAAAPAAGYRGRTRRRHVKGCPGVVVTVVAVLLGGRIRPIPPCTVSGTPSWPASDFSDTPERGGEIQQPVQQRASNGDELRRTTVRFSQRIGRSARVRTSAALVTAPIR